MMSDLYETMFLMAYYFATGLPECPDMLVERNKIATMLIYMLQDLVIESARMIDPFATTIELAKEAIDNACVLEGGWRLKPEWMQVDHAKIEKLLQKWKT